MCELSEKGRGSIGQRPQGRVAESHEGVGATGWDVRKGIPFPLGSLGRGPCPHHFFQYFGIKLLCLVRFESYLNVAITSKGLYRPQGPEIRGTRGLSKKQWGSIPNPFNSHPGFQYSNNLGSIRII